MLANSSIIYAKRKKIIQNGVLYGEAHSLGSITVRGLDLLCAVQSSWNELENKLCHLLWFNIFFQTFESYRILWSKEPRREFKE